jgi:hypothetical protein
MKDTLVGFFGTYAHEIVFLHVLSAFVWVGGMMAIRFAVHPGLQAIEDPKLRLGRTLAITGKFFHFVMPFILLLILTAVLMAVGLGFRIAAVDETGNISEKGLNFKIENEGFGCSSLGFNFGDLLTLLLMFIPFIFRSKK